MDRAGVAGCAAVARLRGGSTGGLCLGTGPSVSAGIDLTKSVNFNKVKK